MAFANQVYFHRIILFSLITSLLGCWGIIAESATPLPSPFNFRQADMRLPRPRPLPTISNIRWKAFPNDLHGSFGSSGRQFLIKPGKPGVIARALSHAGTGDTILLQGGNYQEGLENDYRALAFQKDGIILRTLPGQRARITPRPGVNRGLEIQANNILIHGLDLTGFVNSGISLGRDGSTVRNIIISEVNVIFPKDGEWHDGIVAYPDNRGIKKPAVDGLLLRNVTVEGASLGISCNSGPCASWWLENVKVTNAVGSGSGADTIAIEEGENIVAINVETTHASADGIDLKARQVLILNSYVHHIQRNGIKLWYGGDIINTIVEHTGADAALVFKEPGHYRVLHSLVAFHNFQKDQSYNLTAGYDTSKKLNVEIVNSIFYNTAGGMFFSNHTKVNINHSLFYGMENKKVLRAYLSGREIEVMLQQSTSVFDKVGLGNNVRFADPQFIKPRTSNFFLKATSPAINRGRVTEAYPKTDRRGELRIKGGAPDIGPYEIR